MLQPLPLSFGACGYRFGAWCVFLSACLACSLTSASANEIWRLAQMEPEEQQPADQFDFCRVGSHGPWSAKPLSSVYIGMPRDDERLPPDCAQDIFQPSTGDQRPRFESTQLFTWQPTNMFHQPTYFDDVPLERYGQTSHPHWQPVISGVRFFLTFPVLPYKMGVDRPCDCITTLGHAPAGSCAPCIKERIPRELDAGFFEAAAAVALVFALP
jgi:hypothetical protein